MDERVLTKVHMIGMALGAARSVSPDFLNRKAAELGALAKQLE